MSGAEPAKILVIMGSVRAGRRCPAIAEWVIGLAKATPQLDCELVDLLNWPLPFDDEASIPATGVYSNDHTKAWSAKVGGADGFVIVSPQYNWGYPAVLKNALDHLYAEWRGKPLALVTYGGHAGDKCAQQLLQVAEALKLRPVATRAGVAVPREAIESGRPMAAEELAAFAGDVSRALRELADAF